MKKVTSYSKGVLAEKAAVKQLKRDGYIVLHERYKTKFGEIDIVVQKGDLIAFIEVKAHGSAEASLYAVTPKSRRRIEQSALWFLSEYPEFNEHNMRFDVMVFKDGEDCIQHLDNAWMVGA